MAGGGVIRNFFPVGESDVLWKHQRLLRKTEWYVNSGKKLRGLLSKIRLKRFQNKYGMHIPLNCCKAGLKIMHVGPILINANATVGKNCSIHINTGLVAGGTTDDAPILEDGVVVGIGAVILGGVHIAKNVAIGANAVVNKSIDEEDIAVAGVPAKKISNNGRSQWNKNKIEENV